MISNIYSIFSLTEFGEADNPIWHIESRIHFINNDDLDFQFITSKVGTILLPAETLDKEAIKKLLALSPIARQKILIQVAMHQFELAKKLSSQGLAIQLWVDRTIEPDQIHQWAELKENVDILFVPFDRFDMLSSHSALKRSGLCSFTFLIIRKKNPFSGLLNLHSQFDLYQKLQLLSNDFTFKSAVEQSNLQGLSHIQSTFLISPQFQNYLNCLKEENPTHHRIQSAIHFLIHVRLGFILTFFIYIIEMLVNPSILRLRVEGHAMRITGWFEYMKGCFEHVKGLLIIFFWRVHALLFPIFKIYYFFKFQFEKRILKKRND